MGQSEEWIYRYYFLNRYPSYPEFSSILVQNKTYALKLLKKAPLSVLCGSSKNDLSNIPYVTFIFLYQPELIPSFLELIFESRRRDITIDKELVRHIETSLNNILNHKRWEDTIYPCSQDSQFYRNSIDALDEFCVETLNFYKMKYSITFCC